MYLVPARVPARDSRPAHAPENYQTILPGEAIGRRIFCFNVGRAWTRGYNKVLDTHGPRGARCTTVITCRGRPSPAANISRDKLNPTSLYLRGCSRYSPIERTTTRGINLPSIPRTAETYPCTLSTS